MAAYGVAARRAAWRNTTPNRIAYRRALVAARQYRATTTFCRRGVHKYIIIASLCYGWAWYHHNGIIAAAARSYRRACALRRLTFALLAASYNSGVVWRHINNNRHVGVWRGYMVYCAQRMTAAWHGGGDDNARCALATRRALYNNARSAAIMYAARGNARAGATYAWRHRA